MTAEETIRNAQEFVQLGVSKIRLTGGEPLIKENIGLILTELAKLPVELAITTNGILIDQYLDLFRQTNLSAINVSLDSLKPERFEKITRRNYFNRVMNNIQLLVDSGFRPKINVVVMRGVNDDEIIDFVKLTRDKDLEVRFIEFMPFDGNKWNWDQKVSHNEMMALIYREFGMDDVMQLQTHPNNTARVYKLKNYMGSFGIISSVTNPFCDSCNRIRLTADGVQVSHAILSHHKSHMVACSHHPGS